MPLLNPGDPFPRLTISTTGGQAAVIAVAERAAGLLLGAPGP
jgi:hypothetical protein